VFIPKTLLIIEQRGKLTTALGCHH
jgi:hypothetical protein